MPVSRESVQGSGFEGSVNIKMQAKISEIFLSYQGEGPYVGSRQLFVRFYGCNLNCVFCDTHMESYKSLAKEALFSRILDFGEDYNEIALTGGEPLLFADFLEGFLPFFKAHRENPIYLETNGSLPGELERVIDHVNIIAMDFKLPSSTGGKGLWAKHKKFAEIAARKELIVKTVVTDKTSMDDIKKMVSIITELKEEPTIVLQPVTPIDGRVKESDEEMIWLFKKYMEKATGKDVMILGQVHKCLGMK
ncbi:MAG: 7-carboxy-7-deazaguanine synthase QueE [Candidatus Omnitrophota bacterium]